MNYKEILEGVVNIINTTEKSDIGFANICAYIGEKCPELKESEDEKTRRALIEFVYDSLGDTLWITHGVHKQDAIEWLKKQVPLDKDEVIKGVRQGTSVSLMDYIDANSKGMCLSNMECADIENALVNEDWGRIYRYMKKKLEKQGEQVSAIRWYDASCIPQEMKELLVEWNSSDATWHDIAFYHANTKTFWNYERELKNVTRWCYVDDLFWKQSNVKEAGISQHDKKTCVENEKNVDKANKVEPKSEFKVGDWIVHNSSNTLYKIASFSSGYYSLIDINGIHLYPCLCPNEYFHLWTLSDVKNGDILYSPSHHLIWIYKNNKEVYAGINMNYDSSLEIYTNFVIPSDACPATKKQCGALLAKMHEAGYDFDFEKKELKKVDQKPAETVKWSSQEENCICQLESLVKEKWRYAEKEHNNTSIKKMSELMFFLKTLNPNKKSHGIILAESKQKWSEEDEKIALSIEQVMNCASLLNIVPEKIDKIKTWLNSLRNRVQSQPKQEGSGEDKVMLNRLIGVLEQTNTEDYHEGWEELFLPWLKSLQQKYTWKPSDEQMEVLEQVCGIVGSKYKTKVSEIYEQLKKLK